MSRAVRILFLLLCSAGTVPAGSAFGEIITTTQDPLGWRIETASSVYQMAVAQDGIVIPVYYGPKGDMTEIRAPAVKVSTKIGSKIREVPFRGGFVEQTPALELIYADGTRDCELTCAAHEIVNIEGQPCLRIDMADQAYKLNVSSFIRVVADQDILEKWLRIENQGERPILLENAQSGSIWLEPDAYELLHYSGTWAHEFMLNRTELTPGVKTLQVRDFKSWASPWFAVRPANDTSDSVWFGEVAYAGNWRIDLEKMHAGQLQVIGGINFWDTHIELDPGEAFTTPKMVFGFSNEGLNGAAQRLHAYARQHVLRPATRNKLRPVLYNSWFATEFDVNETHQLELARIARDMGVELFVIDDGWFKGRVNDRAGLGDWTVDRNKFPNGLQPLIKAVKDMGMGFGIWVEPEMVNPDSDLYHAHPDWVLHYPQRTAHEHRNQLTLNLAREDVYTYLLQTFTDLLQAHDIDFIKWDRNRPLSEPGWPSAPKTVQRELRIRYVDNLFRLIDELQTRFPKVMFETCSGGGGRINLQMLARMDQAWISDNTCPTDRVMMQYAYLNAFPANTMVSWVTDVDWHQERPSLKYRFDVSMAGVLGVGADIAKWSTKQRELAADRIALYKQIRPMVQQGRAYRLLDPFENQRAALAYVTEDRSAAVVFTYNMWDTLKGSTRSQRVSSSIKLQGLDPEATYQVSGDWQGRFSGQTLMNLGLPWFAYGDSKSGIALIKRQ